MSRPKTPLLASGNGTPQGSNFSRPGLPSRPGPQPEASHIQELSHSVLQTPTMMSNFQRRRGFMDVNRMLRAPTFNPDRNAQQNPLGQGPGQPMSSTGLIGQGVNIETSQHTQVIWGTNISASELQQKLKHFLNTFVEIDDNEDENMDNDAQYMRQPFYWEKLKELRELEETVLEIDCEHLRQFDPQLYRQLEDFPCDIIPIFDLVATAVYKEMYLYMGVGHGEGGQNQQPSGPHHSSFAQGQNLENEDNFQEQDVLIQVRPFNLRKIYRIRELDPSHIEKLITLRGIIIRCSDVIPEMKEAAFTCDSCQQEERRFIEKGKITEPTFCNGCNKSHSFKLDHNLSLFSDKQHVKVQETPESVPEGETPQTIHLCAYEDFVDEVRPGDRVEITGVFRAMGVRVNPNRRTLKNIYRTYVDVINYLKSDKSRVNVKDTDAQKADTAVVGDQEMHEEGIDHDRLVADQGLNQDHASFSEAEVAKFRDFAKKQDVYDLLIDSLAPSIWENQDVKKGILTQLFGGVSKELHSTGRGRFRGEINILLCGDPSTAKSQLLQYVHKIAPRGIYTSGKGSSAVGLTVYITKDPETKEIVLESGALVLSDRGICCIDEFDKMDDGTRNILHEAMEQQTVSVAKAGIICTLNARTAILAAANPVQSKYNTKLSVVENIKLPPTLLSRFDLIYLVLDHQSEASDRRLANHIVSLYSKPSQNSEQPMRADNLASTLIATNLLPRDFLAKYISYARKYCQPRLSDQAEDALVQEYRAMRNMGNSKKTITATPRQLESMIRISEAIAKMRLATEVEKKDVEEAVRLIKHAMQQSATNPTTGEIDMGLLTTGFTASSSTKVTALCDFIKNLQVEFPKQVNLNGLKYHNLFTFVNSKSQEGQLFKDGTKEVVPETLFREALMSLENDGFISTVGHKMAPTIRFTNA